MAYHIERGTGDIVIDGFEAGIADAPEQGIAMMRNINIVSIPGEGVVNFATSAINTPTTQVSGASCTTDTATHSVTWTPGIVVLYTGNAVTFGASTGGVTSGVIYWVGNISGSTFKVYTAIGRDASTVVNVTDASNTFTVITFGQATHKALDYVNGNVFFLDANGRAWWVNTSGDLTYIGNNPTENSLTTHGNGLCVFGVYLFVFRDAAIDYLPITELTANNAPGWQYRWQTTNITSSSSANAHSHFALVGQDGAMYFCNDKYVGRVLVATPASGPITFDPTSSGTYTYSPLAFYISASGNELSTCLAELGTNMLIGGIQNKIYIWDRIVSSGGSYPVILSENYTTRMVTTNSTTYIFAGNRGRIYQTNGANVQLFKKIPDHIVLDFIGSTDPYYTWLDAMYWKNQIYFSFSTAKNDGTAITNLGGVWALDVSMNIMGTPTSVALRQSNTLSFGVAGYPYAIAPNIRTTTPAGAGLYIAWSSSLSSVYGVDVTTSSPYTTSNATAGEIYCDLIPTGTSIDPKTFKQIEFKLSAPLVSGERVRLYTRQNYSDSWSNLVGTTTTVGALSDNYTVNFQKGQWIQVFAELCSTASTPSYTRLKEIRLKKS